MIGYIDRVSPLKNSSRTPYFDRVFQKSAGQTRAVRFYPENRSKFKALSEKKSPVKLTQFRSNAKFGRTDLVIDRRRKVSEAATKLPFKRATGLEEQENLNISSISQLAKLCQLSGTKVFVVTHPGQLKRQNGFLVDLTGYVKIFFFFFVGGGGEFFPMLLKEAKPTGSKI